MTEHYTAWLTTSPDCLSSDFADITVLADENNGSDDQPSWQSTGDPVHFGTLRVRHDDDPRAVLAAAAEALTAFGWLLDGPTVAWVPVPSGYITTVTREQ